jgi:hypothetical protein
MKQLVRVMPAATASSAPVSEAAFGAQVSPGTRAKPPLTLTVKRFGKRTRKIQITIFYFSVVFM